MVVFLVCLSPCKDIAVTLFFGICWRDFLRDWFYDSYVPRMPVSNCSYSGSLIKW